MDSMTLSNLITGPVLFGVKFEVRTCRIAGKPVHRPAKKANNDNSRNTKID